MKREEEMGYLDGSWDGDSPGAPEEVGEEEDENGDGEHLEGNASNHCVGSRSRLSWVS